MILSIHIGSPKAASSSTQRWLLENKNMLIACKVSLFPKDLNQQLDAGFGADLFFLHHDRQSLIRAVESVCRNSGKSDILIISSEKICSLPIETIQRRLQWISHLFDSVHLIYVCRDFDGLASSLYFQAVYAGNLMTNFTDFKEANKDPIDYLSHLLPLRLSALETVCAVHTIPYDTNTCKNLITLLTRERFSPPLDTIPRIRQSSKSSYCIALMSYLNHKFSPPQAVLRCLLESEDGGLEQNFNATQEIEKRRLDIQESLSSDQTETSVDRISFLTGTIIALTKQISCQYKQVADDIAAKIYTVSTNFDLNRTDPMLPKDFDPRIYLIMNYDVLCAGVDPIEHYLISGRMEGRNYSPFPEPESKD